MTDQETPRLSPSIAKVLLDKSPKHAYAAHRLLGGKEKDKPSTSQVLGSAVDAILSGTDPVGSASVLSKAKEIAETVKRQLTSRGIVGQWQVRKEWDSEGQVKCSGVIDLVPNRGLPDCFYDLKTAHDLSNDALVKSIELYSYDLQMAAYTEALFKEGQILAPAFIFVETSSPYDVRIITMSSTMLGNGMAKWLKAVARWKDCLESGFWPGRGDAELEPSMYAKARAAQDWLP